MYNSQEVANCIKNLAKSRKIAIGKMLSDCNLSINTLSSMQSGGYYPRAEAICKIADYLDCSVDYLLGRTDNPEVNRTNVFNYSNKPTIGKVAAFGGGTRTVTHNNPPLEEESDMEKLYTVFENKEE